MSSEQATPSGPWSADLSQSAAALAALPMARSLRGGQDLLTTGPFRVSVDVCRPDEEVVRSDDASAEILIVAQGSATQILRARQQLCKPLSVSYRPPDDAKRDKVGEQGLIALRIRVDAAFAAGVVRDYFAGDGDAVHYPFGALGDAPARVLGECSRADASPLMVDGLMRELIASAARASAARARVGGSAVGPANWLTEGIELMRQSYRETITIEAVARSLGVAPAHFSRVFRRCHGLPAKQFLRHLRLEEAARALSTTGRAISEIALSLGFADQAHFTREFKKWAGKPPNVFRRERRAAGGPCG